MKNLVIAAIAATAFTAGAASAGDLAMLGGVEYAVEAKAFEATAGVEYAVNDLTFTTVITLDDAAGDLDFAGADLTVNYAVNDKVGVYATVETDSKLRYAETTVGVAFRF